MVQQNLPVELYRNITEGVEHCSDLLNLSLVSRPYNHETNWILYGTINLDYDECPETSEKLEKMLKRLPEYPRLSIFLRKLDIFELGDEDHPIQVEEWINFATFLASCVNLKVLELPNGYSQIFLPPPTSLFRLLRFALTDVEDHGPVVRFLESQNEIQELVGSVEEPLLGVSPGCLPNIHFLQGDFEFCLPWLGDRPIRRLEVLCVKVETQVATVPDLPTLDSLCLD